MMGVIRKLKAGIPDCCRATKCDKDGCKVLLNGMPSNRFIVDMDCEALGMSNSTRCDYLFVGENSEKTLVMPIELKSGRVKSISHVVKQLEGGAALAAKLLPQGLGRGPEFQFVPVLAHDKTLGRRRKKLLAKTIRLRGDEKKIKTLKCGDQLAGAVGR